MNFQQHVPSFAHHSHHRLDQPTFDPLWSQPLGHSTSGLTLGGLSDPHSRVAYTSNALGLVSDHREQNHIGDLAPPQHFVSTPGVSHQGAAFVESYYPGNAVAQPMSSAGFADTVDSQPIYTDHLNAGSGDQYWALSGSGLNQDAVHNRSHSIPSSSYSTLIPHHLNANQPSSSSSSAVSQLQGYQASHIPQPDHSQLYVQSRSNIQLGNQQYLAQLARSGPVQQQSHVTKSRSDTLTAQGRKQNVYPDSNGSSGSSSSSRDTANANRFPIRLASPPRQKPVVLGWPPAANKGVDASKAASSGSRPATKVRVPSPPRDRKIATGGRQPAVVGQTRVSPAQQQAILKVPGTKKSHAEKKQTLACLFCRERKIACGRPPEGSPDDTCNQCARRNFKCQYPTESRRGQHKRNKKAHDVNDSK